MNPAAILFSSTSSTSLLLGSCQSDFPLKSYKAKTFIKISENEKKSGMLTSHNLVVNSKVVELVELNNIAVELISIGLSVKKL